MARQGPWYRGEVPSWSAKKPKVEEAGADEMAGSQKNERGYTTS